MMERLLTVNDVSERYQCGATTARKYMRAMEHMENPLMVTEKAVTNWERSRTVPGTEQLRIVLRRHKNERKRVV